MTGVQPIVASYTCHEGATLVGSEIRTCQEDGSWSGEEPSCRTGINAKSKAYTRVVNMFCCKCHFDHATIYTG